jgi:hypothetical protein
MKISEQDLIKTNPASASPAPLNSNTFADYLKTFNQVIGNVKDLVTAVQSMKSAPVIARMESPNGSAPAIMPNTTDLARTVLIGLDKVLSDMHERGHGNKAIGQVISEMPYTVDMCDMVVKQILQKIGG